jgi:transposase-like protein
MRYRAYQSRPQNSLKHKISSNTIYGWISAAKKRRGVKPLPRNESKRLLETEKLLESVSRENTTLKQLLGEKEFELAVLRELRDAVNPR